MTIEEKIDNFKALLRRSYQAKESEDIMISVDLLESGGLSRRELREVICPSLVVEGFLRSFSLDLHIIAKEDLVIRAIDFGKDNINDMEFTADIPSYEFIVNKEKLNQKFGAAKKSNPPVFDLPPDSKWEDMTIKFKENSESIEIFSRDKLITSSDYKKMGFGKNKPDKQWGLLRRLAAIYATNEQRKGEKNVPATVTDLSQSLLGRVDQSAQTNIHSKKKALSSQLMQDFGIYDDPFDDYNQWGYYKTKFNLIPEPPLRYVGKEGVWIAGKKYDDATSYKNDGGEIGRIEDDESIETMRDDEILEGKEDEA